MLNAKRVLICIDLLESLGSCNIIQCIIILNILCFEFAGGLPGKTYAAARNRLSTVSYIYIAIII